MCDSKSSHLYASYWYYFDLIKRLREVLQLKESDVEALRRKTRLMEVNQEEKFHEEKGKIVQILGELYFLVV